MTLSKLYVFEIRCEYCVENSDVIESANGFYKLFCIAAATKSSKILTVLVLRQFIRYNLFSNIAYNFNTHLLSQQRLERNKICELC